MSVEQISIGFMSSIVTFLPSLLMIFFFKKSRRRVLRPNRITEALKAAAEANAEVDEDELLNGDEDGDSDGGHPLYIDDPWISIF